MATLNLGQSPAWHSMAQLGMVQHGVAWLGTAQLNVPWHGLAQGSLWLKVGQVKPGVTQLGVACPGSAHGMQHDQA